MLSQKVQGLRKQWQKVETKLLTPSSQPLSQPPKQLTRVTIRWLPASANVAVLGGIIALWFYASGIKFGWTGYASLVLGAVLLLINLPLLPALVVLLFGWLSYGVARCGQAFNRSRLQWRWVRLDKQIAHLQQQQLLKDQQQQEADEWKTQTKALLLSHYYIQRERAELAARLTARKKPPADTNSEPELSELELEVVKAGAKPKPNLERAKLNGRPQPAPHTSQPSNRSVTPPGTSP